MNFFKNRAIKKILRDVPPLLKRDYGGGNTFTIGQVCAACKKASIKNEYMHYAVVLFSKPQEEIEPFNQKFPKVNYQETRMYLADMFFDGNIDFEIGKSKYSKTGNTGQDSMAGGTYPPD